MNETSIFKVPRIYAKPDGAGETSLNAVPGALRVKIGFFGTTNVGKSSLINALTGQEISIVSGIRGTTTDAVSKAMEIAPIGPVTVIDTPGLHDETALGKKRMQKSRELMAKVDIAILVVDATELKFPASLSSGKAIWSEAKLKADADAGANHVSMANAGAVADPEPKANADADAGVNHVSKANADIAADPEPKADAAAQLLFSDKDQELLQKIKKQNIPYIIAINKSDELSQEMLKTAKSFFEASDHVIFVSARTGRNINELKDFLGQVYGSWQATRYATKERYILKDLIAAGDLVVMITPIDESAPKGRLILPQQQTLREILDCHATALVVQPEELAGIIAACGAQTKLFVTDSQVFATVEPLIPPGKMFTSFSILFARYKGDLEPMIKGCKALQQIRDAHLSSCDISAKARDKVASTAAQNTATEAKVCCEPKVRILIAEGCTHHRQCNDIGTVKLPKLITRYLGFEPEYSFASGGKLPADLADFDLVFHCGGCMLTAKEMSYNLKRIQDYGVSVINYGIGISFMNGILAHSLSPFPEMLKIISEQ